MFCAVGQFQGHRGASACETCPAGYEVQLGGGGGRRLARRNTKTLRARDYELEKEEKSELCKDAYDDLVKYGLEKTLIHQGLATKAAAVIRGKT